MALSVYSNGIGGTTGHRWTTVSPLITDRVIWYVDSVSGSDAASPRGKERVRPLATLAQAVTNASAGDIIACLSTHTETLTSSQSLAKRGLWIVSEGTGTSRAKFKCNGTINMFDISADAVLLGNLYFPASSAAPTSRVKSAAGQTHIEDCYFECGTSDTAEAVQLASGATDCLIKNTTFISTSTSVSSQPYGAIRSTGAINDLWLDTVVFDGGSSGWSNPYCVDFSSGAVTGFNAYNIDLLNDSDMNLASSVNVLARVRNTSGSARVV